MHRSITFSEMLSSTFSNEQELEDDNAKKIFVSRLGIGLIEVFTSTLFFSYGIIFSEYVSNGTYTLEDGFWATIIYITTWNLVNPWSKNIIYHDLLSRPNTYKYVICLATVGLAVGVLLPGQITFYGIFGGFFSNLIYNQLRQVASEYFQTDGRVFEGNVQCARAFSLLIVPHLLLFLTKNLSMEQVKLVLAGLLLNIIPAVLIIKRFKDPPKPGDENPELSRYQTIPGLLNQMQEMIEYDNTFFAYDLNHNDHLPIEEEVIAPVTYPASTNVTFDISGEYNEAQAPKPNLIASAVQDYFSKAGVTILPGIPEEKETEDELESIKDSKRTSKAISENIQETIQVMDINDWITRYNEDRTHVVQNIEYIPNYNEEKNFLKHIHGVRLDSCCNCMPEKMFSCRRRTRVLKDFLLDHFIHPFKDLHLYPVVLSKTSVTLMTSMTFTLGPHIALMKNKDFKKDDTAFLLSYVAFSWCLFLVLLPLVLTFTKRKLRGTYVCGLVISGISMILLGKTQVSNDFITLSCLFFGFGHGMTSYTENTVHKNFMGTRRWKILEGAAQTMCAVLVLTVYFMIYKLNLDFISVFPLAAFVTYLINAIVWVAVPMCKSIIKDFKERYSEDGEMDGEYF